MLRDARTIVGFGIIEALVAITMLAIGLTGVAGLASAAARLQVRVSVVTEQAAASARSFDALDRAGFDSAGSGVDTVTIGGRLYIVELAVVPLSPSLKEVRATVFAPLPVPERSYVTWLSSARP